MTLETTIQADSSAARPPRNSLRGFSPRARTVAIISYLGLIILALVYIYPFMISIAGSFTTDADATADPLSIVPETWSFAAYERLFIDMLLS